MDEKELSPEEIITWKIKNETIKELAIWVRNQIQETKKPEEFVKIGKARQYVYEFILLGRAMNPGMPLGDRLFATTEFYKSDSMIEQLGSEETYKQFWALYTYKIQRLDPRYHTEIDSEFDVSPYQYRKATKILGSTWGTNLDALLLRYRCIGGLDDNMHLSVPKSWSKVLPEDTIECFASPLNHKFKFYYSAFEEDAAFGSKGSFFKVGLQNGCVYEINPPWNNQFFVYIASMVDYAIVKHKLNITIVIIGPNWEDASWVKTLNNIIQHVKQIRAPYSCMRGLKKNFVYVNDFTGNNIPLNTKYWIFSSDFDAKVLATRLGLF